MKTGSLPATSAGTIVTAVLATIALVLAQRLRSTVLNDIEPESKLNRPPASRRDDGSPEEGR